MKIRMVSLKENASNLWSWCTKSYTVQDGYAALVEGLNINDFRKFSVAWNKLIPLKVTIVVWRL